MQEIEQSHYLSRWIFLRLLGLCFLCAFISALLEIEGLIGSKGILPLGEYLDAAKAALNEKAYFRLPTLFWLNHTDSFLRLLCINGIILSSMLILSMAPALALLLLWIIYLSIVVAGQVFFNYQWDALLLEVAFFAIFFAPRAIKPKISRENPPSMVMLWLLRLILFKLMVLSGIAKLASGDMAWRNLTALTFHYETQPLPTAMALFAHGLPQAVHAFSTLLMFLVELVAPLLIFMGASMRTFAFIALVSLQLLIMFTGNYCFFNLLTIALCFLLLNDSNLLRLFPQRVKKLLPAAGGDLESEGERPGVFVIMIAALFITLNVFAISLHFGVNSKVSRSVMFYLSPLRTVNTYGLFAVMTKERNEIVIEGSNDGKEWKSYEFKYKPGTLHKMPGWVAPLQPRLDWQMWFAALSRCEFEEWVQRFIFRLLSGSSTVLQLLEYNPFPAQPPQYIRAMRYKYNFLEPTLTWKGGGWWYRMERGEYCPVVSLTDFVG